MKKRKKEGTVTSKTVKLTDCKLYKFRVWRRNVYSKEQKKYFWVLCIKLGFVNTFIVSLTMLRIKVTMLQISQVPLQVKVRCYVTFGINQ